MKAITLSLCFVLFLPGVCMSQTTPPASPRPAQTDIGYDVSGRTSFFDNSRWESFTNPFFSGPHFDMLSREGLHVTLAIQEEYNSNINLTENNRVDDFITTIATGLRYGKTGPEAGIDLNYLLGYNMYSKHSDLDYISHFGTLNSFYNLNRNFTFRIREYLLRSDEPREFDPFGEFDQYFISTSRERSPHLRNIVEPEIEYHFGPHNNLSLFYRNEYYDNEDPIVSDGIGNTVGPRLTYWFNIRHGIELAYSYTCQDENLDQDWRGHNARGRYIYRINQMTSIFGDFVFEDRSFDPPSADHRGPSSFTDYRVYTPSLGIDHAFSPSLSGSFQAGYYTKQPEVGESESHLFVNALLSKRTELTTFNIVLMGGYREEYLTAENLGFVEYKRAEVNIVHKLTARLRLSMAGAVERADYSDERRDWIYGISTWLSWNPVKWLTITPNVSYRASDSNTETHDYKEFRGLLRIAFIY